MKRSASALALAILTLALVGGTCTEEKVVDLVIGFPTTVTLIAEGEINTHSDSDTVNVKTEIDLETELLNAGIDPTTLDKEAIKVAQVFYRVIDPDPVSNRRIVNGSLTVFQVDGSGSETPAVLVDGWSMNAGVGNVADPQEWIDITADIGPDGIRLLNAYIRACICELLGEGPVINPEISYEVSGDSVPAEERTSFTYEIKVLFQGKLPKSFDIPFG